MNKRSHNFASAKVFCALLITTFFGFGCGKAVYNPKNADGLGPASVVLTPTGSVVVAGDLSAAGNYVILSKAGISNVTGSAITGNIAVSPAAETYITGFSLTADPSTVFSTSASVIGGGKVYAANSGVPTPANLTTAVGNMETAYNDAASRNPPDFNELHSGAIGGQTLVPGLYTWTTSVSIATDVTISGSATDVWIFQTTGDVTMASAKSVILSGGALAKNIFWQVAGKVTIGTTAAFKGIILCKTLVSFLTLASLQGRIYSQTEVTLDNNTITQP